MAVFVALGAFLMTLAGGWTAQRVTDRRHLVLGLAGGLMLGVVGFDLLPEALAVAGREVFGVPAALLLFVAGFLLAHLVERLLAARRAAHGATEHTQPLGHSDPLTPAPAPTTDGAGGEADPLGGSGPAVPGPVPAAEGAGGGAESLGSAGSPVSGPVPGADGAGGDARPLGPAGSAVSGPVPAAEGAGGDAQPLGPPGPPVSGPAAAADGAGGDARPLGHSEPLVSGPVPAPDRTSDRTQPLGHSDPLMPAPAPTADGAGGDAQPLGPPGPAVSGPAAAADGAGGEADPLGGSGPAVPGPVPAAEGAGGGARSLGLAGLAVSDAAPQAVASPHFHEHRSPEVGLTAAGAMVGHSAMDGVAIGAAFQVDGGMGAAVALAVIAHDFADGFNTFTLTSLYGNARRKALAMLFADACAPLIGALSTALFTIPEQALGGYLGLFGGVLLYLAAAEILPEAHHQHPARSTVLCTVAGAAFIWLVVGIAG